MTKSLESVCAMKVLLAHSVKKLASSHDVLGDVLVKMVVSVRVMVSATAPLDGLELCVQSVVQRAGMGLTVPMSVYVTMVATVIQRLASVCAQLDSRGKGVMKSVLWAPTGRSVKVCVTVPMAHGATTSTEAACVSRASGALAAERGCVLTGRLGCTVNSAASATHHTQSAATRSKESARVNLVGLGSTATRLVHMATMATAVWNPACA